ncbi:hypothetical protein OROGR_021642 [Orobanche gracilis]
MRGGLGWILRDSDGGFIAAKGTRRTGNFTPKEAEALCIREALEWAKGSGYDGLDVETDAQQVLVTENQKSFSHVISPMFVPSLGGFHGCWDIGLRTA